MILQDDNHHLAASNSLKHHQSPVLSVQRSRHNNGDEGRRIIRIIWSSGLLFERLISLKA